MARFERHAFVCINDASCGPCGGVGIARQLKRLKVQAGLKERLRVNKSGCLGQCGHGPMMVVYPEGVWYSHLTDEDAERVWREHIVGGQPVEDLMYRTRASGTNVLPLLEDGTPDRASPHFDPCSRC